MPQSLQIAAAQFPVSDDIAKNKAYIHRQMKRAAALGAQVIHFPETALSGYAPKHHATLDTYPWKQLQCSMEQICQCAAFYGIWVILGSMSFVDNQLPKCSLLVISNRGEIVGRYDKRRLYGKEKVLFSPGDSPLILNIHGVTCGFLICYDNCFPELYNEYRDRGVDLLFHSFYNAANHKKTSIADLIHANLIVRAADNQMWISASNSSEPFSPLAASIVRPDGTMVRARRHVAGFITDTYGGHCLGWTYDNRNYS